MSLPTDPLIVKWKHKIAKLQLEYDSASHNGSFQGQVIAQEQLGLARQALADLYTMKDRNKK